MPTGLKLLLWFLGFITSSRWESLIKLIVMWGLAAAVMCWYLARTVDDERVNGSLNSVGTKQMLRLLVVTMIIMPLILGAGTNFTQLIYAFNLDQNLSGDKVALKGVWPVIMVIAVSLFGTWAYAWRLVVTSLQKSKLKLRDRIDHYLNFNRVLNLGETCLIVGSMALISLVYMGVQVISSKTMKWLILVEMLLFIAALIWMVLWAVRLLREFRLKWIRATIGPKEQVEKYYHVPTNAESYAVMQANHWIWAIPIVANLGLLGWLFWWSSAGHQRTLSHQNDIAKSALIAKQQRQKPKDYTKKWRANPEYRKQIQLARKNGDSDTGGTTIGEVIAHMGKPKGVDYVPGEDNPDVRVVYWPESYGNWAINTVSLYVIMPGKLNDARVYKIDYDIDETTTAEESSEMDSEYAARKHHKKVEQ